MQIKEFPYLSTPDGSEFIPVQDSGNTTRRVAAGAIAALFRFINSAIIYRGAYWLKFTTNPTQAQNIELTLPAALPAIAPQLVQIDTYGNVTLVDTGSVGSSGSTSWGQLYSDNNTWQSLY